jgi:ABC-type glycerol-3-phosphate transport system permease component
MSIRILKIINYLLLILIVISVLVPFFWMLSTALKSENEALMSPPQLLPATPHFENFVLALTVAPFLRYFLNTLIVSVSVVLLSTIVTVLASFAFARAGISRQKTPCSLSCLRP